MVHQRMVKMKIWTCRKESVHTLATPRATRIVEERTSIHAKTTKMATPRPLQQEVSEVNLTTNPQTVARMGSTRAMLIYIETGRQRWMLTKLVTILEVLGKRTRQFMSTNHR